MTKKCYSLNNENFYYDELDEAVADAFDDLVVLIGSVVSIYEGDAVPWKAGDFACVDIDTLSSCAYDNVGECVDDWPNSTKEQDKDLEKRIAEAVNQWADIHGLQPNFYQVCNIKEIKVEFTSEVGDYEILTA